MQRGRKPKPTHLKIVQGTQRPDRTRENEPKPQPIAPKYPVDLDDAEKEIWKNLAPKLTKLGILTEIDGHAFALLCKAGARYERADARLRVILAQTPAPSLEDIRRAEVSVEKAEHSCRLLESEFGMTPAARTRIDVGTADEEDEFEQYLDNRVTPAKPT